MSSLKARLQNPDYINWVKAGLCLIHTKAGLDDVADTASKLLHQSVLTNIIPAYASVAQPVCGISIRRQNLTTTCAHQYCKGFLAAVTYNGIDPQHAFTIRPGNLANCNVGQWHNRHWEVAKLFMNQGQLPTQVNPSETDMSGIINFLSHCKVSRNTVTNVLLLDEVSNDQKHFPNFDAINPFIRRVLPYDPKLFKIFRSVRKACLCYQGVLLKK